MSFLAYFFVVLVAASSVLFGMDWMQAPLKAPAGGRAIQAVSVATPASAAPAAQNVAVAKPTTVATSAATTGSAVPSASAVSVTAMPVAAASPANPNDALKGQPGDELKTETSEAKPAPLCDIAACERAYQTFTPADCTYKPFEGQRRLCTKGNPPRRPAAQVAATEARAQAGCNVSVCASIYSSFDAATCTYQPFDGMRRICTK
jgi:BA14K-like protein